MTNGERPPAVRQESMVVRGVGELCLWSLGGEPEIAGAERVCVDLGPGASVPSQVGARQRYNALVVCAEMPSCAYHAGDWVSIECQSAATSGAPVFFNDPALRTLGLEIRRAFLEGHLRDAEYLVHLARALYQRARETVARRLHTEGDSQPGDALARGASEWMCDWIRSHIGERLTLRTMSSQLAMSPQAFSRAFKKSTGLAPHVFVLEERLLRARALLLDLDQRSIADIALECGFSSQAHMTAVFTQHLGISPARFRSQGDGKLATREPSSSLSDAAARSV